MMNSNRGQKSYVPWRFFFKVPRVGTSLNSVNSTKHSQIIIEKYNRICREGVCVYILEPFDEVFRDRVDKETWTR